MLNNYQIEALYTAAASRAMLKRAWLLDALTVTNNFDIQFKWMKPTKIGDTIQGHRDECTQPTATYYTGQIVQVAASNGNFTAICLENSTPQTSDGVLVMVLGPSDRPAFDIGGVFDPGDKGTYPRIKELFGVNPFTTSLLTTGKTTVGRFIENVVCLQYPINFRLFPYVNGVWNPGKIVKMVTKALVEKQITVEENKRFLDYFFFLNHITEIAVPSMTVKSLMTHPDVPRVKAEFIKAHQGQMHDPVVIKELEDLLAKLDAEWLGRGTGTPDPSVTFFDGLGSKSYDIHRKKLFLTTGGVPAFKEQTGDFDFIPNSLMEGWTIDAMPSIANEIRKGSYERGRETAKGGAETKLVMRVFQDLAINHEDCGTKRTIPLDFKNTCRIDDFIGRTIQVNGQDVVITEQNKKQFDGQVLNVYSPMTCAIPHDLCYKCCGSHARDLGAEVLGIQVVKITSQFMNSAMKNMHGTVLKIIQPKLSDIFL